MSTFTASTLNDNEDLAFAARLNAESLAQLGSGELDAAYNTLKHAEERLTSLTFPQHSNELQAALALLATTYNNISIVYSNVGHFKKAVLYCQRALALERPLVATDGGSSHRVTSTHGTASTHSNMCVILSNLGRHSTALSHAEIATRLLRQHLSALNKAQKAADQAAGDAPPSASHIGLYELLAAAYHNVGVQQQHLGKHPAAQLAFQQAKTYTDKCQPTAASDKENGGSEPANKKSASLQKLIGLDLTSVSTDGKSKSSSAQKKHPATPLLVTAGIDLEAVTKSAASGQRAAQLRATARGQQTTSRARRQPQQGTSAQDKSGRRSHLQGSYDDMQYTQSGQRPDSSTSAFEYMRTLSNDGADLHYHSQQANMQRTAKQSAAAGKDDELIEDLSQYLNLDVVPISNLRVMTSPRRQRAPNPLASRPDAAQQQAAAVDGDEQQSDAQEAQPAHYAPAAGAAPVPQVYYLHQGDAYPFPSLASSMTAT